MYFSLIFWLFLVTILPHAVTRLASFFMLAPRLLMTLLLACSLCAADEERAIPPQQQTILIYTGYAKYSWSPETYKEHAIGGSETAAMNLARIWASMGYNVSDVCLFVRVWEEACACHLNYSIWTWQRIWALPQVVPWFAFIMCLPPELQHLVEVCYFLGVRVENQVGCHRNRLFSL